ncbi:MAG: ubiquinone biosynthesis regulatory protein kinase UbiB [Pseudomonadota bacterium]|nr:ubiquinone biosynthesis regulatory protein kinase UbiB [Pseudomonadota bacterium]
MFALFRIIKVIAVCFYYGLDQLILPKWVCPSSLFVSRKKTKEQRLKDALEALGPIYVKFGQILSTRHDMLPANYVVELAKLQDKVKPFSSEKAEEIIERELDAAIKTNFKSFSSRPLASASVAQVHAATLKSGEKVVIKILRPNIAKIIKSDIALMRMCTKLITPFLSGSSRMKLPDVIAEFEHNILNELDLVREGGNASQIRRNSLESKFLYVPKIYWDYSTKEILVLERISGISIGDIAALKKSEVDLEKLAKIGVEIFFSQVFKDRFFHADMHPGNIFVDISDAKNPRYIAVDFGIVGALSEMDQRYIAENFLAFFKRDYGKVAQLHVDSGWVPADTRVDQFEMDIRAVCEPVFARPLQEICFGKLLLNLFNTAKKYKMTVQPQLILLQKTLFAVEALGSRLYPQLNLWDTAKPYLEEWVKERVGLKGAYIKTKDKIPFWLENSPEVPDLIFNLLEKYSSNKQPANVTVADKSAGSKYTFLLGAAFGFCIAFFAFSAALKLIFS